MFVVRNESIHEVGPTHSIRGRHCHIAHDLCGGVKVDRVDPDIPVFQFGGVRVDEVVVYAVSGWELYYFHFIAPPLVE